VKRSLAISARGAAVLAVPLLLIAVWGSSSSPEMQRVIVNFFITLVLVYGLQVFSGNSGIISLGHVSFMGIGAYVAALLTVPALIKGINTPGLPTFVKEAEVGLIPSVAAGAVAAALVAAVIGLVLVRMRENALSMATIALLVIFYTVVEAAVSITHGPTGLYSIPAKVTVWIALAFAVGAAVVALLCKESPRGRQLRATRDDALAAAALGVDVFRTRLWAWVLSAAIMGVGGALFAEYNLAFDPTSFYFNETFLILSILVIGGSATVSGATVGAALLSLVNEVLRRMEAGEAVGPLHLTIGIGIAQIVVAVLILLILWLRPEGLMGATELDGRLRRLLPRRRSSGTPADAGEAA
jgi:branched-chain amino acid transport system permease protein